MRGSGGVLFIAVGLLLLYIGVTGKYRCLIAMFDCMAIPNSLLTGQAVTTPQLQKQSTTTPVTNLPTQIANRLPGVFTPPFAA